MTLIDYVLRNIKTVIGQKGFSVFPVEKSEGYHDGTPKILAFAGEIVQSGASHQLARL